jgi:toxin-antitoxin system PIN domain toxin
MISIDANLLLYAYSELSPFHAKAVAFITELGRRTDVALCEFVLAEVYVHLRNPAVLEQPLSASDAVAVVESYRQHPRWRVLGFPNHSRELHAELWRLAATRNFARRRIYDARTALCLRAFGVTQFATVNTKDFESLGFSKVWNPLDG